MEYPKIHSLYKREGCGPYDEDARRYKCDLEHKKRKSPLILGEYALPEFEAIDRWSVTEKIDGTNVRIMLDRETHLMPWKIEFRGRTSNAQFPTFLYNYLASTFTVGRVGDSFKDARKVILFGEGYGPKIQSGGYYRKDVSFILFDVWCDGYWLTREGVADVAKSLGIDYTDCMWSHRGFVWSTHEIVEYVKSKPNSVIADEAHVTEGIIARSEPQMLFRNSKHPIMFKLKCSDF